MMFKQSVVLAVALLAAASFDDVAVSASERRLKKGKGMPGPPGPPKKKGDYYYYRTKVKNAKKNSKKNLPTKAPTPAPQPPPTPFPVGTFPPTKEPVPVTVQPTPSPVVLTSAPTFSPIELTKSVVEGMAAPPGILTVNDFDTVLQDTTQLALAAGRRDRQLHSLLRRSLQTSGCDVDSQSEQRVAQSAGCTNFFTAEELIGVTFCYKFSIIISSNDMELCDVNMAAEVVMTAELEGFYDETCGAVNDVEIAQLVPTPAPIMTTIPSSAPQMVSSVPTAEQTMAPTTQAPVPVPTPAPVTPETPAPVTPETPAPVTPETPAPVTPETPAPVTPETPAPVTPETPAPVTPETPAPVTPETPAPVYETGPPTVYGTPNLSPDGSPDGSPSGSPGLSIAD